MGDPVHESIASGVFRGGLRSRATWLTLVPILGSISLGLISLFWYNVGPSGFFWALACLAVGSLFGIVFGIPREATRPSSNGAPQTRVGLIANTNMEEISDWLTKLLVGAGLVELKSLPGTLKAAARHVADSLPTASRSQAALESIAASLILFFVVEGFIGGYLITRIFFQIAFQRSDEAIRRNLGEEDGQVAHI